MTRPMERLDGLVADAAATFAFSASGRILRENDPDRSPGPRLYLAGCAERNLVRLRHDVDDAVAARIEALVAEAPPWSDPDVLPACLPELLGLLSDTAPAAPLGSAVIHALPAGLAHPPPARLVRSSTGDGHALLARLARDGMPRSLVDAGFLSTADFWAPWCVAMAGDEIAAMAFAARTGPEASSIGVYTFPGYRGGGLAAAVTAAWANLPELAGRALFYSASWANISSIRVIARLGLPRVGVSLRIP